MFRARRYRVLIVFAAVLVLLVLHFARSRDWSQAVLIENPTGDHSSDPAVPNQNLPAPEAPAAQDGNKYAPPSLPNSNYPGYPPSNEFKSPVGPGSAKGDKNKGIGSEYGAGSETGSSSSSNAPPTYPSTDSSDDLKEKKPGSSGKLLPAIPQTGSSVTGDASDTLPEEIDHGGTGRLSVQQHPNGPAAHWTTPPERFPVAVGELIKLPKEASKAIPKLQAKAKDETSADKQERLQRLSTIKAEFKHAWAGYKKAAMGHDEVKPLSESFEDPFNGWGATLVDSLDTLWIMDMKDEFSEAVDAVRKINFTTSPREDIPIFETVIRYLGGLLGAYDISGQKYGILLEKAEELAGVLIGAFDTPNRMPVLYYRWTPDHTIRPHRASAKATLAEIGSLSLEFTRLAQLTKEDKYYDAIARVTNRLEEFQDSTNIPGLWPVRVNAQGCAKYRPSRDSTTPTDDDAEGFVSSINSSSAMVTSTRIRKPYVAPTDLESYVHLTERSTDIDLSAAELAPYISGASKLDGEESTSVTEKCDGGLELPLSLRDNRYGMGGLADSTYEYLPKEYLMLGGVNDQYKKMYKKAMDAARKNLLFTPMVKGERDLRFMASTGPLDPTKKGTLSPADLEYESTHLSCFLGGMVAMGAKAFSLDGDLDLAAKLTDGCVWAYESTNTGIMPERFRLLPCSKDKSCEWDEKLYQADVKRYSHVMDSEAEARFRTGESAYGQRVKMSGDVKSQEPSESGVAVPLPMPGSTNPRDKEPIYNKRDAVAVERGATPISNPTPISRPVSIDNIANREAPRPAFVAQSEGNEINDRLPPGMTSISAPEYFLRPEAIESVFIMFRLTGDEAWRRKGWKMFEAITKHTRTNLAHAGIKDVTAPKPAQKDAMESFWTAETLKYFYLLFSDPSLVDLDKYVL
ncbi:uncharacterized protein N7482_003646 [Penicillium canariense]|uniref:alpha-1,2-Mannosidase n=1 Tax=Penicillium canariense TaxID=189055 RepID=A0A9W9I8Y5_9EURO|nr:uncharacterized protein N7482_003646 [Penicillium canariense]KAJ5168052.1 hypothetical protein N7482_003646 [Penicillium canariense]